MSFSKIKTTLINIIKKCYIFRFSKKIVFIKVAGQKFSRECIYASFGYATLIFRNDDIGKVTIKMYANFL